MSGGGGYGGQMQNMYNGLPQNWGGGASYPGMQFGGRAGGSGMQGRGSLPPGYRQPGTPTGVNTGYGGPQGMGMPYGSYGNQGAYNTLAMDMSRQQYGRGGYGPQGFQYSGVGNLGQWPGMGGYGYGSMAGGNPFSQGGGYQPPNQPMGLNDWRQQYGGGRGGFGGMVQDMFGYMGSQRGQGPLRDLFNQQGGMGYNPYLGGGQPPPQMAQTGHYTGPIDGQPQGPQSVQPAQQVQQFRNYRSPFAGGGVKTQYGPQYGMAGGAPGSW